MRPATGDLLAAALVVLAGCSGGFAGATGTPTVTPAPVPTDVPMPERLAPGLTTAGVADARTLLAAHASALENASYTRYSNRTVRRANGTLLARTVRASRFGPDHERYHVVVDMVGPHPNVYARTPGRVEFWSGERNLWAYESPASTRYFEVGPIGTWSEDLYTDYHRLFALSPAEWTLFLLLDVAEVRVTERRDDTYIVESGRIARVDALAVARSIRSPRGVSVRAIVGPRGVVRRYRIEYTATFDGEPVRVVRRVRYVDVGRTTPERPSWYANATRGLNETDARSATPAGG